MHPGLARGRVFVRSTTSLLPQLQRATLNYAQQVQGAMNTMTFLSLLSAPGCIIDCHTRNSRPGRDSAGFVSRNQQMSGVGTATPSSARTVVEKDNAENEGSTTRC